jgi:hypothetical protein
MTAKERREYIINLDKVVKRWRRNSRLFCGGCCFSAGQIAKLLERKNIRYQVICWECGYNNETDLKKIIKENNCCHVAIQVSVDGNYYIIGGNFGAPWVTNIITYKRIRSKQLIEYDLYGDRCGTWNSAYNRNLNNRFINILTKSVEK